MRQLADAGRIRAFMRSLGDAARADALVYLAGGATAVLLGWRETTIDVDIAAVVPESDELLRTLPRLKDELQVNVELASPADFIPVPDGWEDRSLFIGQQGRLSYYHFDLHAQALAKLERAHAQDLEDVGAMLERGLVVPDRALGFYEEIEPLLYRFPAVDAASFRRRVEQAFRDD